MSEKCYCAVGKAEDVTAEQFRAAMLGDADVFSAAGLPRVNLGQVLARLSLAQAISTLHALASKTLPDGRTISWWPLHADQSQVVHVGQVLDQVLVVLFAAEILERGAMPPEHRPVLAGSDAHAFMQEMQHRITNMQVFASGEGREAAAEFVQSGVHVLIGMLPAANSPGVAALDAELETVR